MSQARDPSDKYPGPNDEAIEAWNTVLFDKFTRFRRVVCDALAVHGDAAMARLSLRPGMKVLDVGCGFGDTSFQMAPRVAPSGSIVGVDAAPRFIDRANEERAERGLDNVEFRVADVQHDPLGGPYDAVYSRFGTMFFASPVAALRNVRKSLVAGAPLAMVVWRAKADNEMFRLAEECTKAIVRVSEEEDAPTCGPGPFSLANPDVLKEILDASGFGNVELARNDVDLLVGEDLDQAVEFALELGPAGEVIRLAGKEGARLRPQVAEAVRAAFSGFVRQGGVYGPSSTWLVSAQAL